MNSIKISLYTDEEREEIWMKEHKKRHDYVKSVVGHFDEDKDDYIYYLEERYYAMSCELRKYKKEAERTEHYRELAHTYKVELGRCVRKLTRIYQNVFKAGVIGYIMGITDSSGKESVDMFKRM